MKRGRDEGRGVHFDRGVPQTRFAFKALCAESFADVLLKEKARGKEAVQEECGVRLVFSNKGDCFPGTHFRVLGIYSDDVDSIIQGFDRLLTMLVDQAEAERERSPQGASELFGKEPGEYIFRLLLSREMGGLLIGHAGAHIKSLREETGGKVFIENEIQLAHRMVRIIGTREVIYDCLGKINELIMGQNETDDFQRYAGLVNFSEALAIGWVDDGDGPFALRTAEQRDDGRRGGKRRRGSREDRRRSRRGKNRGGGDDEQDGDGHVDDGYAHYAEDSAVGSTMNDTVDMVADVVDSFPSGMHDLQYMVSCKIPVKMVSDVSGRSGEFLRSAMEASDTEIVLDTDGTLTIQGRILHVYQAHAFMMKRVYEAEAAASAAPKVQEIQNKLQDLQRQLNALKQQQ